MYTLCMHHVKAAASAGDGGSAANFPKASSNCLRSVELITSRMTEGRPQWCAYWYPPRFRCSAPAPMRFRLICIPGFGC